MLCLRRHNLKARFASRRLLLACLLLAGATTAQAQYGQTALDGYTPTDLKQGAPAGSFPLSGFENINHYNGGLNIALPLLRMGGRGGSGFGITLKIDEHTTIYRYSDYGAGSYAQQLIYSAGDAWRVGYGPGVLLGKWATNHPQDGSPLDCGQYVPDREYNTRLYFTTPDGTEIQLQDKQYGGLIYSRNPCTVPFGTPARNRGKVFVSADGEKTTFISDTDIIDNLISQPTLEFYPSGHLLLSDGTRYRVDGGKVSWMRDRNGNKTSFTYDGWAMLSATDSLNRQVTVTYGAIGAYDEITYRGYGGAARSIKVWHHWMHDAMRPDCTIKKDNQLYPEVFDGGNIWSGDSDFDMAVVSRVEMPDGRSYRFFYNSYGEVARVILPTGGGTDYNYSGVFPWCGGGGRSTRPSPITTTPGSSPSSSPTAQNKAHSD
jgi:YD repeat-containing protein